MDPTGMLGYTAAPPLACFHRPCCKKMAKVNITRDLIHRQLKVLFVLEKKKKLGFCLTGWDRRRKVAVTGDVQYGREPSQFWK